MTSYITKTDRCEMPTSSLPAATPPKAEQQQVGVFFYPIKERGSLRANKPQGRATFGVGRHVRI
jgi:hypothetical protein